MPMSPHRHHHHHHQQLTNLQEMEPHAATSLPPMNALEILRETVRLLRSSPLPFLSALLLLLCPVSAALLSVEPLLLRHHVLRLSRRLLLLLARSGLPVRHLLLHQLSHHLSGALLSSLLCLPLLLSLLLPARSLVSFSVASLLYSRSSAPFSLPRFLSHLRRVYPRLLLTYALSSLLLLSLLLLFLAALAFACNSFSLLLAYPPDLTIYPALLVLLVFSVIYAHLMIICNLAAVISVLEDASSGLRALLCSVRLIEGQTQAGLLIFLGSTIGLAFVEGLFEHRVKTLSYGDGSSRIWEGPLLVLMYSFVVLIDFMMSAVFYFTCRSSGVASVEGMANGGGGGSGGAERHSLVGGVEMERISE
ncbi:uncharacterized protein M6B38_104675 [Iris pallida]|uniref:Uncharacterized protein n=1 Tax=Iris pallida TaxID=29817 RepID=A0AAX6F2Z9_IRIPA|nr:uncharacterized protein M6B38_104675 [Iris pallida]